jgi:ABC-2 type transport system permease protein
MGDNMKELFLEIKKEISFAYFSVKKNLMSSAELRGSFLVTVFGMALNNTAFVILWMAFGKIAGNMGGWQATDVLGQLAFGTLGFGICFTFLGGIRELPEIVAQGNFDKFMLNPKSILLRVSTSKSHVAALGDLLFGIITLTIWFYFIGFTVKKFIFAIIFILCSAALFYFFSVLTNSVAFYFADARSLVQGLFEFLITPSLFYGGAFQGVLRFAFIFIVPALMVGGFPVEAVKSENYIMVFTALLLTCVWAVVAVLAFCKSVRKYESSNFINFG